MDLLKGVAYIKWERDIEELCTFLQDALRTPGLYIETDQDPPHDKYVTGEALFFEIDVIQTQEVPGFQYEIIIRSQMMRKLPGSIDDLSPWLVEWLQVATDLEVMPGNIL